jgi:tetratricopeptide (TPR) repeat protein
MGGRAEEAIEPAEKAMRLDPMNTDRYWWLAGIAYLGMGRWEDAAAVAEKVLKVNPEFTPAQIILVLAYAHLDRTVIQKPGWRTRTEKRIPVHRRSWDDALFAGAVRAGVPIPIKSGLSESKGQEPFQPLKRSTVVRDFRILSRLNNVFFDCFRGGLFPCSRSSLYPSSLP